MNLFTEQTATILASIMFPPTFSSWFNEFMKKGLHSTWSISNAQLNAWASNGALLSRLTGLYELAFDTSKLICNTLLMYFLKSQDMFQWQSLYEKQNYFSFHVDEIDPIPSTLFGTAEEIN